MFLTNEPIAYGVTAYVTYQMTPMHYEFRVSLYSFNYIPY